MFGKLIRFFEKKKISTVIITDSQDCPCYKTIKILRYIKSADLIVLSDVSNNDILNYQAKLKNSHNLIIIVHGSLVKSQFYYRIFINNIERDKFIDNIWWTKLNTTNKCCYFHSCYGAQVLRKINKENQQISQWVSYSDLVYGFESNNKKLNAINNKFFKLVVSELQIKKSPESLKTAIKSIYYSLESDLQELKNTGNDNNCDFEYIYHIVTQVGNNVNSLEYSTT